MARSPKEMKIKSLFLIPLLLLISVFSFGEPKGLEEYIDLGKIPLKLRGRTEVPLPYYKPEGITEIPSEGVNAIVIHNLTVDGKQIRPTKSYFSSNEAGSRLYVEKAKYEGGDYILKMRWFFLGTFNYKGGLFYTAFTGDPETGPDNYNIAFKAKEIFLTYSIRFYIYADNYTREKRETETYTVRFELRW
jgi:hypothetical protein